MYIGILTNIKHKNKHKGQEHPRGSDKKNYFFFNLKIFKNVNLWYNKSCDRLL